MKEAHKHTSSATGRTAYATQSNCQEGKPSQGPATLRAVCTFGVQPISRRRTRQALDEPIGPRVRDQHVADDDAGQVRAPEFAGAKGAIDVAAEREHAGLIERRPRPDSRAERPARFERKTEIRMLFRRTKFCGDRCPAPPAGRLGCQNQFACNDAACLNQETGSRAEHAHLKHVPV